MIVSDAPTSTTGYASAAFYTGKYLRRMGFDIAYVALQNVGGPQLIELEKKGSPLYQEGIVPSYAGNTTLELDRAFEDWKPDIGIHIRDIFAHTPAFFSGAYSFAQTPHHPPMLGWVPVQNDLLPQDVIDAANREYAITVTYTEWGRDVLLFQGVPSNKLDFVWLGFDEEVFHPVSPEERIEAKKWLGVSTDKPVIVSVGINDQHRKGWPLLIQALSIVKKRGIEVDAYFHTTPDGTFLLRHFAKMFGIPGQIAYPEVYDKSWGMPHDYMQKVYNAGDIYCSASIEEGFGVPVAEAMATGSSEVLTDMPNYREIGGDFALYPKTYKLYPTGWSFGWLVDPEDMAAKIIEAIEFQKDAEADKIRRQTQLEFAQRYTWKAAAEKWASILKANEDVLGVKINYES